MSLRIGPYVTGMKTSAWFLVFPEMVYSSEFFNRLDSTTSRFFELIRTEGENAILRKQNIQLSKREVERDALEEENNRLRSLLELRQHAFPEGIAAEVLGREVRDWFRSVAINKGADQGISLSAAVVSGAPDKPTLVGRIADVRDGTSKVLLLSDPLSAIAVTVVRTGDMGLLEGQNRPWIALNYLPHLSNIVPGDEVVTAGLGGVFPAGIPVGEVASVKDSPDNFFKEAKVIPHANLGSLREVLVMKRVELPAVIVGGKKP
jgi:rod shape-determining protein MreC